MVGVEAHPLCFRHHTSACAKALVACVTGKHALGLNHARTIKEVAVVLFAFMRALLVASPEVYRHSASPVDLPETLSRRLPHSVVPGINWESLKFHTRSTL